MTKSTVTETGSTARTESRASNQIAPYRFLATYAPYRKDGTPVLGNFGATMKAVVIFEAEEFKRLIHENPVLKTVPFIMGEF